MKVSVKWLKEYVDYDLTPVEVADKLTMTGSELEEIVNIGQGVTGVIAGRILTITQHAELEKLVTCLVDIGCGNVQVVTGAPNVKEGVLVPVAMPGANLAGGHRIETVKFHGIESEGMLCSEVELGIGQDSSGIMILPESLKPGDDVLEILDVSDTVLDFEITPNRPDCLSMLGMAREVAAIAGTRVKYPLCDIKPSRQNASDFVSVRILDNELCKRYSARVIRNVEIKPSPLWLQRRLRAAGMRPINNIVDITNFVLLEYGQPLHAFDYDLIGGREVLVRCAKHGEKYMGIDGEERILDDDMLVIADQERAIAVAGVMGGMDTEVTSATQNILLESANFNAASVRRTSRKLGLRTEASARFEKGLTPAWTIPAIDRAAYLMQELAGGTVLNGIVDVGEFRISPVVIDLSASNVNKTLGAELSQSEMKSILASLEFEVQVKSSDILEVKCPDFRQDVELEADLIEEIARMYGFDKIQSTLPKGRITEGGLTRDQLVVERIGEFLSDLGLSEVITYSFVHPDVFDKLHVPEGDDLRSCIRIKNPLTEDQSIMRTTLIPSLLEVLSRNEAHGTINMSIYELGSVYMPQDLPLETLPRELKTLAIAIRGERWEHSWDTPRVEVDFFDLKGILEVLLKNLGIDIDVEQSSISTFHPGQQANVFAHGRHLGVMGQIHPVVAKEFELGGCVFVAELNVEQVVQLAHSERRYQSIPRYPAIVRDIAVVAPDDVFAKKIEETIREIETELIEEISLFDMYVGEQIPKGYKSLAYSITYRAKDRTLTDQEVDTIQKRIVDALKELGTEIRQ
jgi:phenylalanyl-tRNA synthetase beta chain